MCLILHGPALRRAKILNFAPDRMAVWNTSRQSVTGLSGPALPYPLAHRADRRTAIGRARQRRRRPDPGERLLHGPQLLGHHPPHHRFELVDLHALRRAGSAFASRAWRNACSTHALTGMPALSAAAIAASRTSPPMPLIAQPLANLASPDVPRS